MYFGTREWRELTGAVLGNNSDRPIFDNRLGKRRKFRSIASSHANGSILDFALLEWAECRTVLRSDTNLLSTKFK